MKGRIAFAFLSLSVSLVASETSPDTRLRHATDAFQDIMKSPDRGIPRDLIEKSQCVVIVPDLLKGAFLVGGQYGRGFASCRRVSGWSSPAAIRIEGGSFGFQLGGSSTDLIMLVMNRRGMDHLLSDKFTLGGDAAAAAGPVGRETSALTDAEMHAEILTWSRSRGLFAGISLEGSTLRPDRSEDRKLYGRDISNREILEQGVLPPPGARGFIATLDRYSGIAPVRPEAATAELSAPGGRLRLGEQQIHFGTAQSTIPGEAGPVLSELAQALKDHPEWRVRIEGYTDNVGSRAANLKLSRERARSVSIWLVEHGVSRDRLEVRGYGETAPIGDNSTPEGRARNRRVEIVRIDVKPPTG